MPAVVPASLRKRSLRVVVMAWRRCTLSVRWPVIFMATDRGTPARSRFRAAERRRSWKSVRGRGSWLGGLRVDHVRVPCVGGAASAQPIATVCGRSLHGVHGPTRPAEGRSQSRAVLRSLREWCINGPETKPSGCSSPTATFTRWSRVDLWARYLEVTHGANLPRFFGVHGGARRRSADRNAMRAGRPLAGGVHHGRCRRGAG
jgi:hypothetical protein